VVPELNQDTRHLSSEQQELNLSQPLDLYLPPSCLGGTAGIELKSATGPVEVTVAGISATGPGLTSNLLRWK
ncbi:hypothetical protein DPMN_143430, partial [Dreissena polymorpha]